MARAQAGAEKKPEAPEIVLTMKPMDPFGSPRPANGTKGVPVRTSLYFELGMNRTQPGDRISTPTIAVTMQAAGGKAVKILSPGGHFERGCSGQIIAVGSPNVWVYLEPAKALDPLTTYTVKVTATTQRGYGFPHRWVPQDCWSFTTGAKARPQAVAFDLDLATRPVHWKGAFFSGLCQVAFCGVLDGLEPSYAMMARDRKKFPKAWGMQRDLWLSGMHHEREPDPAPWSFRLPNIVRELETRRIATITTMSQGYLLQVEDFLGHAQYGIATGRPLSGDYREGYEVLIADGKNSARARVLAVDDRARTVLVSRYASPAGGFTLDAPPANQSGSTRAPGIFPNGGCYLRRFAPLGTPRYYWGRLDAEWDIAVKRYGIRPIVNFCDAPGDIADNGKSWSPPKDWAQLHEVTRTITSHIIERYGGEAALTFFWSIFNEPDLMGVFWMGTWEELCQFYDTSVDAILRAFEDHGLNSDKVFIGGLELAAPFPQLGRLDEFLIHCSPNGTTTASLNTVFADRRLDGKRSRRVEALCRAHGGKGSPCDFISVHIYRASAMASLLTLAKSKALAIDPEYYKELWACSHETCPAWAPPPGDRSSTDVYLGNGYYPAWCADYVWRQLTQGARDARYAMGNTVLSYWPWPAFSDFLDTSSIWSLGKTCAATQTVKVDDDGDGKADRKSTLALPIYNFLNMLGSLGEDYWVLPERTVSGHTVAGFAGRGKDGEVRVLLYAHDPADLQGRAGQEFKVELNVAGLAGSAARVTQYRFDRTHHSYFDLAKKLQARGGKRHLRAGELRQLESQVALKAETIGKIRAGKDGKLRVPATLTGNSATFLIIQGADGRPGGR